MRWGVFLCVDVGVGVWGGVVGRGENIGCAGVRLNVFGRGEDVGRTWGVRGVCWVCKTGSSCVPALPHRLHHSANGALGISPYFDLRRRLVFLLVDPRTSTSSGFASLTHLPLLRGRLSICRMSPLRPKLELQNGRKKPSPMQGKAFNLPDESASSRDKKQQHHRMLLFSFCMFCGCGLHLRFAGVCHRRQRMFRGFGLYQRIRIETGSSVTVRPSDRVIVDGVIRSL